MDSVIDLQSTAIHLQRQLSLARDEINNLRKEIKNLKHSQAKENNRLKGIIQSWKCSSCRKSNDQSINAVEASAIQPEHRTLPTDVPVGSIELQPVGFITTGFIRKRAVPRQPNVNLGSHGKINLLNDIFTNPEHSLEGLDGFSHMWVLFYFHKNQSNHIRAKVAPPRLNGTRVGVFGTRSPHRPCPIGLSLVQIDKIEGSCIYFSGVDMLDGTPVLDLKPYIPHYDNPTQLSLDYPDTLGLERLELDGQESDTDAEQVSLIQPVSGTLLHPVSGSSASALQTEREAPDGEEEQLQATSPQTSMIHRSLSPLPPLRHVRVPDWISQPSNSQLLVTFSPQAESQLSSIESEVNITRIITDILQEDPRSVYLRDRYANQFYTFLINNFHVSCKFNDTNHSVKVFRVVAAETLCDCGRPRWQCDMHGNTDAEGN